MAGSEPARPRVLYAGAAEERAEWTRELTLAAREAGLAMDLRADPAEIAPEAVDYLLLANSGPIRDLRPYVGLRAILSLWAGVEKILARPDLPRYAPLARMVEPGLTIGMTDYVVAQVMRAHLRLDRMLALGPDCAWENFPTRLSRDRGVGVLGLGVLGLDAARMLRALRFRVSGWSRAPKQEPGVTCFAGPEALDSFLARAEILVVLLPQTPDTIGLLHAERLARLPRGAHIVNVARGPILPERDLLAALESGAVGGATLDVFDVEPLPKDHPYWSHPRITVTPHIAAVTRPETASKEIIGQIKRHLSGEPLRHVVDGDRGY